MSVRILVATVSRNKYMSKNTETIKHAYFYTPYCLSFNKVASACGANVLTDCSTAAALTIKYRISMQYDSRFRDTLKRSQTLSSSHYMFHCIKSSCYWIKQNGQILLRTIIVLLDILLFLLVNYRMIH